MAFKKLVPGTEPRAWSLVGFPGDGKSTFAARLSAPILTIDADHRFGEVSGLTTGDVYQLSDTPADNNDPRAIARLLRDNMPGSGVKTIVIDSLTALIAPLVTEAIQANDAGENNNKMSAFKDKALALRSLQDSVSQWGVDTLWVYHLRKSRDYQAQKQIVSSISTTELARLRRSLNMELRIVYKGSLRGVTVDWARRGRSGVTLWDRSGSWEGIPEAIEHAVYDGLTESDKQELEETWPTSFRSAEDAIAWGWMIGEAPGAFRDAAHTKNAYEKLKSEHVPSNAAEMWKLWTEDVKRRIDGA